MSQTETNCKTLEDRKSAFFFALDVYRAGLVTRTSGDQVLTLYKMVLVNTTVAVFGGYVMSEECATRWIDNDLEALAQAVRDF